MQTIKKLAPEILKTINDSNNILLHLHVKADPDSVGSALSMKWALQKMGKKVIVIEGDTPLSETLNFLPGSDEIIHKNYFEIDISEFDLFLILDSGDLSRISMKKVISFPDTLKTIVIDHHKSNPLYGDINLVLPEYSSTSEILFDLLKEWEIEIDKNMAANLFIGIYGDTGGFNHSNTTSKVFKIVAELTETYPDFVELLNKLNKNFSKDRINFLSTALSNISEHKDGSVVISSVDLDTIKKNNIDFNNIQSSLISNFLLSVKEWNVAITLVEIDINQVKASFRSKDETDVSKIANLVGGGGHIKASGAFMNVSLIDAKNQILEAIDKTLN